MPKIIVLSNFFEEFSQKNKTTPIEQILQASIHYLCKTGTPLVTVIFIPIRPNRSTSETKELEEAEEK